MNAARKPPFSILPVCSTLLLLFLSACQPNVPVPPFSDEDQDGDGAVDYMEQLLGTDPQDPSDNPDSRGYLVIIAPRDETPRPTSLSFSEIPAVIRADLVFAIDSTASMSEEIANLRSGLGSLLTAVSTSINDVACGLVEYRDFPYSTYGDASDFPFRLRHRVVTVGTAGTASLQSLLDTLSAAGGKDMPESSWEMLHQIATGEGTNEGGSSVPPWDPATAPPLVIPIGEQAGTLPGVGFRAGTLRCVVWITDAVGHNSPLYGSYDYSGLTSRTGVQSVAELQNCGIRVLGIDSGSTEAQADQLYAVEATETRVPAAALSADDISSYGMVANPPGFYPLLFRIPGSGTGLCSAIAAGIAAFAGYATFDVHVQPEDDPSNSTDAVLNFVERVEAAPGPGQTAADADSDGHPETLSAVPIGATATFSLLPKRNTSISQTVQAQLFSVHLVLKGDGDVVLGSQTVYFVVPPLH